MSETSSSARWLPYAGASALACALGIGAAILLPAPARGPAVYGALAASAGALCSLFALAAAAGRGINGLLAGFTIGFLCRAVLVAAGLFASGARGNLALVYVAAFFTLYLLTQTVEVLFVKHGSRSTSSGATP